MATPEKLRLFVALELPARVRDELAEWRSRAAARREDLRPVPVASLHVTLAFLGSRPSTDLPAVRAAVVVAARDLPPPQLEVAEVKPVPPRRPRLFAFDLIDATGRAAELQAAVSAALAAGGHYRPEKRAFWPHVTFARVRRGVKRVEALSAEPPAVRFDARQVTLYRSHLSPRGARYEALERVELGG